MPSFKMLVEQGKDASLFSKKLVSSINGESKAGYVFTIYAQLSNFEELTQANTKEIREKRLILDAYNDKDIRTTATIHKVNDIGYYLSTKVQYPDTTAVESVRVPISQSCHDHLAINALSGIAFDRYKFPIAYTDQEWEIDVFRTRSGEPHDWVRIELEVDSLEQEVPKIPVTCEEYIFAMHNTLTKSQADFIDRLYKHHWMSLDTEWLSHQVDYKELIGQNVKYADDDFSVYKNN